jgi:LmbE family N-acetylglucosaminyl deacetylase
MKRALAVAAHPDDIEFMMVGTLLRLKEAGWEIHYWNLSSGNQGTNNLSSGEITRIRREEAIAACRLAGATFHEPITDDLEIFYNRQLLLKVAAVFRIIEPEIVLTHYPQDYMEDHSNTARLAVTAAFSRSMVNYVTDPPQPVTMQHVALYHAMPYGLRDPFGREVTPDFYVDISGVIDRKLAMLACHRSQKEWLDVSQGQDAYLQTLRGMCSVMGSKSGRYDYAEGWIRHLHLGLADKNMDPLRMFING